MIFDVPEHLESYVAHKIFSHGANIDNMVDLILVFPSMVIPGLSVKCNDPVRDRFLYFPPYRTT